MKSLVYTTTLTSALIFSVTSAQAANLPQSSAVSHLTSSAALPRNARAPFAKYRLGLQVSGRPLSQLKIDIPESISFASVNVTDGSGQDVQATTAIENQALTIQFMQPVAPNTNLKISLNSVWTGKRSGRIWLFPIAEKSADMTTEIPLGIARIHTYD
ncbi:MAG: DUF2808 domain-containing protein [Thermosynechococcaceae cyanobacterium]